jgi:hypothetical protein
MAIRWRFRTEPPALEERGTDEQIPRASGSGLLWLQVFGMAAIGATMVTVSVLRFRKSLE